MKARRFLRNRLKTASTPAFTGPQVERVVFAELKAAIVHDYTVKKNRSTDRPTDEPDVADAGEFAYLTLARRDNVLRLDWSWLTLGVRDGTITGASIRLPGAVTKNGKPLSLVLKGRLLEVTRRPWEVRIPTCPYVFHRQGRRIATFKSAWETARRTTLREGFIDPAVLRRHHAGLQIPRPRGRARSKRAPGTT